MIEDTVGMQNCLVSRIDVLLFSALSVCKCEYGTASSRTVSSCILKSFSYGYYNWIIRGKHSDGASWLVATSKEFMGQENGIFVR